MTVVLFAGPEDERADIWRREILKHAPEIDLRMDVAATDPGDVEYLLYAPNGPVQDLAPYAGVKALINLWAGVEKLLANPTLPDIPVARMVEYGMTEGMTDYVIGHVMQAHLGCVDQRQAQARGLWIEENPPLSRDRRVGIIGLGALGRDAAEMLARMRFQVAGWSRTQKDIPGVECFAGPERFRNFMARTEILVLLAPRTPDTENLLNAGTLAMLPQGARIINAARGELIDDDALLAALNSGHIAGATLDVFRDEPLPEDHPYWSHPGVTITAHVASVTRAETAAITVAEQIRRGEAGKPLLHLVNRDRGY